MESPSQLDGDQVEPVYDSDDGKGHEETSLLVPEPSTSPEAETTTTTSKPGEEIANQATESPEVAPAKPNPSLAKRIWLKVWGFIVNQWFIIGLAVVILVAYLAPQPGKKGGWLHPEITAKYVSVIVIFILTGMSIKVAALKNALMSWKIQLSEFIFFTT